MSTLLLLLSIALVAALSAPIKESSAVAMTTRNVLRVEKVGDSTLKKRCCSTSQRSLELPANAAASPSTKSGGDGANCRPRNVLHVAQ